MPHLDALERDAGEIGGDHRERGVMPLAVRARTGVHDRAAIGGHFDGAELAGTIAVGDLDIARHADAEQLRLTGRPPPVLLLAQGLVAGRRERLVESAFVVAAVVARLRARRIRESVGRDEVAAAHLGRVDADLLRETVDHAFDRGRRLRTARAAERADRCGVRDHGDNFDVDPIERVHAAGHQPGEVRQHHAVERIRTAVGEHPQPIGQQRAVARAAELALVHLRAPVVHAEHVLGARLRPAHRPAEIAREPSEQGLLGVVAALAAETAAHVGRDHVHLVVFEAVGLGQAVARAVGALGARVLVQSLVGVPPRHRGTRFHRSDGDTLVHQPFPHDDLAAIKQIGRHHGTARASATFVPASGNSRGESSRSASSTPTTAGRGS